MTPSKHFKEIKDSSKELRNQDNSSQSLPSPNPHKFCLAPNFSRKD